MPSAEVNFHFILYSREHSMRESKIYKAYCGAGKNHRLSADLASWNFKRLWKRNEGKLGPKRDADQKQQFGIFLLTLRLKKPNSCSLGEEP